LRALSSSEVESLRFGTENAIPAFRFSAQTIENMSDRLPDAAARDGTAIATSHRRRFDMEGRKIVLAGVMSLALLAFGSSAQAQVRNGGGWNHDQHGSFHGGGHGHGSVQGHVHYGYGGGYYAPYAGYYAPYAYATPYPYAYPAYPYAPYAAAPYPAAPYPYAYPYAAPHVTIPIPIPHISIGHLGHIPIPVPHF
jgi:hypothetical protein